MKSGIIKSEQDIHQIAESGRILRETLQKVAAIVKPGITTFRLNELAEEEIQKAGALPAFKGYGPKKNPFPAALCTSINDVVVHGIPDKFAVLEEGDIVGLDLGVNLNGYFSDAAITVGVGHIDTTAKRLMETTDLCLKEAIKQAKPGNKIGQISHAIQSTAEAAGFSVVRDLVGHGVGYDVHEDPAVPCYGKPSDGIMLKEGMVLAIEPMLCEGAYYVDFLRDGWTIVTHDGKRSAHFEHTIAITKNGAKILA